MNANTVTRGAAVRHSGPALAGTPRTFVGRTAPASARLRDVLTGRDHATTVVIPAVRTDATPGSTAWSPPV